MKINGKTILILVLTLTLIISMSSALYATVAGAKRTANRIATTFERAGYNVRDTYRYGVLTPGETYMTLTTLYEGTSYVFIASGDEYAYDVDLRIYDENGKLVARDDDYSDVAVVKVTPRWSGQFYMKITMTDCPPEGAHWVLVIGQSEFAQPGGTTVNYFKSELASPTSETEIVAYFQPIWSDTPTRLELDAYGRSRYSAYATVYFDNDEDQISPQSYALLNEWGRALKGRLRKGVFMIEGHTDSRGRAEYNQELSERRAESVRWFLIQRHGINPARLIARGFGKRFPIASNKTEAGRAQNRRVNFTLVDWWKVK